MRIAIVNGPNLNLLGTREPEIYGSHTLADIGNKLMQAFPDIDFSFFQSNIEGELIDHLQAVGFADPADGIVLNAGGYSHTSVAIADCIRSLKSPVICVHISNTQAREEFRVRDLVAAACRGSVSGLGIQGYELAVRAFL